MATDYDCWHEGPAPYVDALKNSVMTAPHLIPDERREALAPILGDVLG